MKLCNQCGSQCEDHTPFCNNCGSAFEMPFQPSQPPQPYPPEQLPQPPQPYPPGQQPGQPYPPGQQPPQPGQPYPPGQQPQYPYQQSGYNPYQQPGYMPYQQPGFLPVFHPYHKLGGWLLVLIIGQFIGFMYGIYQVFLTFGSINELIEINDFLEQYFGVTVPEGWLYLSVGLTVVALIMSIVIAVLVIIKNHYCVLVFHIRFVIDIIATAIAMICMLGLLKAVGESTGEFYAEVLPSIIGAVIGVIIWTIYFKKSVRMRTYMRSDRYLRYSPLTKNAVSPVPADGSAGY